MAYPRSHSWLVVQLRLERTQVILHAFLSRHYSVSLYSCIVFRLWVTHLTSKGKELISFWLKWGSHSVSHKKIEKWYVWLISLLLSVFVSGSRGKGIWGIVGSDTRQSKCCMEQGAHTLEKTNICSLVECKQAIGSVSFTRDGLV